MYAKVKIYYVGLHDRLGEYTPFTVREIYIINQQ